MITNTLLMFDLICLAFLDIERVDFSTEMTAGWGVALTTLLRVCLLWSHGWDRGAVSYLVLLDTGFFSGSCSTSELA
jgi:hypothetical protein